MASVKGMVNQVLSGQLKLDIRTAEKIIEKASDDGRIENAEELAPLQALFANNDFKSSVDGTTSGKRLIQGFLDGAKKVNDDVGEARDSRVGGLHALSIQFATELLSKDAVLPLISQYRGAVAPDDHYVSVGSTTSIREVTPKLVEAWRQHALKNYKNYLEGGSVSRFFTRMGVGQDYIDAVYEKDPADEIRRYLETYSVKKSSAANDVPLDTQVRALESRKISEALTRNGGDRAATARTLGISESVLDRKIREYGLG